MIAFYVDYEQSIKKTYRDLYDDLTTMSSFNKYIYESDTYTFFKKLLFSILQDLDITILDADFSKEEIERLGIDYSLVLEESNIEHLTLSYEDFLKQLKLLTSKGTISLYTSGTTGIPKKATHKLDTLTRNVKTGERFKEDIWGFAYNATHLAGLQVFFQALSNHNPIVNLFNQPKNKIQEVLLQQNISHISATSTFYRTIIPYLTEIISNVRYITFGGEKFDDSFLNELIIKFPNAKIRNIYASTEAGSLFTSKGNVFLIPNNIQQFIKFSDENELMIHQSLLGVIDNGIQIFDEEWFYTGDIIEKKNDNEFIFVSRKSDIINVGGYNVNPHEIESELCKLPFVVDAVVKARANRVTGNIITAEIIVNKIIEDNDAKKMIKDELSSRLQAWKIPRIIKIVDEIPRTRTGKKVRK